ncbi:hypothetical protein [Rhodohalobacter sp.]|uniref:hypothetical protein n=1 Tax=Rhodohalobacter sp. TaxID=1974210 RepID=UPI002ACDFDB7|nr:hypothetical protein [Rhodohalobacter sp.]MDZ7756045.1 hypothetical protein [Rhodohalobacter sp.]
MGGFHYRRCIIRIQAFRRINLTFLSFPAFILFFHLAEKTDSYKQLAYYSYAGFVVWNLIGTYWLMMATVPAGVAAILANSVLMTDSRVCLAKYFSEKSSSPILISVLQASAWVGYEFLHHHWDLSWTWLAIGNAWSNWIGIIQYISVTGFLGISFWVVFTSSLTYQLFILKKKIPGIHHVSQYFCYFRPGLLFCIAQTMRISTSTRFCTRCHRSAQSRFIPGLCRNEWTF